LRALTPEERALEGLEKRRAARSDIPAVTHVDGSARIQTVRREIHPLLWETLEAFRELTGCAVLVNTSFNVRGEPIVCTPEDSYRCFRKTGIDALALEGFWLEREEQAASIELPAVGAVGLD
jgi:carbamoyltransferase